MAESPAPASAQPLRVPVSIATGGTGGQVTLTEMSARILMELLDQVHVTGSQAKFQLAIAQRELETGLAAITPAPDSEAADGE